MKHLEETKMKRSLRVQWIIFAVTAGVAMFSMPGCRTTPKPPDGPPLRIGKFSKPLLDFMAATPASAPIPIIVTLHQRLSNDVKRALFQAIPPTNKLERARQQRRALTRELQLLAQQSQQPLLTHLRTLETNGAARGIKSLWIANAVAVSTRSAIVTSLTSRAEVMYLDLDQPVPVDQQAPGEVAWGITKINTPIVAPELIQQSVVVAVLDTGVDYTHPDLAGRIWVNQGEDLNGDGLKTSLDLDYTDNDKNGYVDDVIGWNFSSTGTNEPEDVDGHGTHVAGIVAGGGNKGVRTGVAPHARIMTLRRGSSTGLTTQKECWEAMQYALSNGAHVVNFSAGWMDIFSPVYSAWRDAVESLTDGGVVFVTGAGNSGLFGDAPNNVLTPGRVPGAITVGWSLADNSVSSKSSKGPVTWESIAPFSDYPFAPGLQKPDLVAPGEGIKSTWIKDAGNKVYGLKSGTSMAAPHVSGVAALLLAQYPTLNPYEVRYLLEESATQVGSGSDPNPKTGWGLVNATAALNLAGTYINATPAPFDLAVDNMTLKTPEPGKQPLLSVRVRNLGGQVVGNVELRFYFADAPNRTVADLNLGNPAATSFTYMGSYFVPVLGPAGSRHGSFEGVVRWTNTAQSVNHWWAGVWVVPGPTSNTEPNRGNNGAVFQLPE